MAGRMGFALAWAALAALVLAAGPAQPQAVTAGPAIPAAIEVAAVPIATFRPASDQRRFGALDFRGGLVLTSPNRAFGGISAFTLDGASGRFLAVTDNGSFLDGKLDATGDKPTGLSDVRIAAMLDDAGRPLAARHREDAESLAVAPDAIYVGLEDVNEIWRFPRAPLGARGTSVPVPATVSAMRDNLGLESLVYIPSGPLAGALVGIGEEGLRASSDDLPGVIIGGTTPGDFTIAKSGLFSATDAALTPSGDLLLLERHYARSTGVKMQLRRFPLAAIKPGARLEGEVLGTFDMGYEIDNMESLAVTRNAAGETLLTIVSDDNFNPLQRTILLRFALASD